MATRKPRPRPKAKPDANQRAAALLQAITGEPIPDGTELLGSEELREALRKAKAADKGRKMAKR